ncbi:MAG: type II secretion system protein [Phycisphaerae bacterium]
MSKRGFTLIELLVVVAIIALLISVLLPSLGAAREQARITKCIANLKSMGNAMSMYASEYREQFPFEKRNWPENPFGNPGGFVLSAFYYGGHPGRPSEGDQISFTFDRNRLRTTFRERPFNRYFFNVQELHGTLERPEDAATPQFDERRKEFTIYQCPSDTGGFFATETVQENAAYRSIFDMNGSSYDINYHWVWMWAARDGGLGAPFPAYSPPSPPANDRRNYLGRANRFLNAQRQRAASRFLMLVEDPFDSAQLNRIARVPWHKRLNKYSFLFLDGHAANMVADTRRGNYGQGWKSASLAWYNDQNDPDYDLRELDP